MKALVFRKMGSLEDLQLEEVPNPSPASSKEAIIEIKNASINPSDYKSVLGKMDSTTVPRIPGRDFSGIVIAGPKEWLGKEVFGMGSGFGLTRDGSHAQQMAVPTEVLVEKPKSLSFAESAAMSLGYLTAWRAIVTLGKLNANETILITGTTGAVGSAAARIAKFKQARVIGTLRHSSEINAVKDIPVDDWISLDQTELPEAIKKLTNGKGVNIILDTVGGPLFEPCLQSLGLYGRQIAIASTGITKVSFDLLEFYHKQNHLMGLDTTKLPLNESAATLKEILSGFQKGVFKSPEIEIVKLNNAKEAYRQLADGKAKKKLVIDFT